VFEVSSVIDVGVSVDERVEERQVVAEASVVNLEGCNSCVEAEVIRKVGVKARQVLSFDVAMREQDRMSLLVCILVGNCRFVIVRSGTCSMQ